MVKQALDAEQLTTEGTEEAKERVNLSGGDIRNPATLRSRERRVEGSNGRFSARQGWAETGDADAGRGGGDGAASWVGLGVASDRGGDRVQPGNGAAVSGCGRLDAMPGSDPAQPVRGTQLGWLSGSGVTGATRMWCARSWHPSWASPSAFAWWAGDHPRQHLARYEGVLQADAYAGFGDLYRLDRNPGPITETACWVHFRRKLFKLAEVARAPLAIEAVRRIDAVFAAEFAITGRPTPSAWPYRPARGRPPRLAG